MLPNTAKLPHRIDGDAPSEISSKISLLDDHLARHFMAEGLAGAGRSMSFLQVQHSPMTAYCCDVGHVPIDKLPIELLLEIFDFCVCQDDDHDGVWKYTSSWKPLVHVCRRWRYIVFAAPRRLNLRLYYAAGIRLDIWPALPIVIEVRGSDDGIDDNVIAALKHNDRICEIHAKHVPWSHLEKLVELMQAPFPALTHLCLSSRWYTTSNLPDSFLGGSAPRLRSLYLSNIPFPALPNLLLSATGLVCLSFLFSARPPAFSVEVMVDCLSSLVGLQKLHINFEPPNASRRQPPLIRSVLPMLNSLSFRGPEEQLEDLYARIEAPLLKSIHINLSDPVIFDVTTILPFVGHWHKEAFEALNQAHMALIDGAVEVTLSSRNGTSGDMFLILSLRSSHSSWRLGALTQDHRPSSLANFDSLGYLLNRDRDKIFWPWVDIGNTRELLRFFPFVENLYLSREVATHVVPTLEEFDADEGVVTEVLPALQNLFIDRMWPLELDYVAVRRFVFAREVSGHPVSVQHRL